MMPTDPLYSQTHDILLPYLRIRSSFDTNFCKAHLNIACPFRQYS
jgi:hypothetical protein